MRLTLRRLLPLAIVAGLACAHESTAPAVALPGSWVGTGQGVEGSLTLALAGTTVSGSGSFVLSGGDHPCGGTMAGTFEDAALSVAWGHDITCNGSFDGYLDAEAATLSGTVDFSYWATPGGPATHVVRPMTFVRNH